MMFYTDCFSNETYKKATLYYLNSAKDKISNTWPWNLFVNREGCDAVARDFTYTYEGQTINYIVLDEADKICQVSQNSEFSGKVVIPEIVNYEDKDYTVASIGEYAFFSSNLVSVDIPSSVTSIGRYAFSDCSGLTSIISRSITPPNCDVNIVADYDTTVLCVPDEAVEAYREADEWKKFSRILAISDSDGVEEVETDETEVEIIQGAVVVKGSESVRVFDMKGAQVYSGVAGRIELPAGIYLVVTDSLTKKVRI